MMKAIAPTNIVPRTPPTIASILVGSFICKTKSNKTNKKKTHKKG